MLRTARACAVVVDGDDSRRLLPAMLQRIQTKMHERAGILNAAHAEYSTHDLGARWLGMLLESPRARAMDALMMRGIAS